jgi:hypothetical protein
MPRDLPARNVRLVPRNELRNDHGFGRNSIPRLSSSNFLQTWYEPEESVLKRKLLSKRGLRELISYICDS